MIAAGRRRAPRSVWVVLLLGYATLFGFVGALAVDPARGLDWVGVLAIAVAGVVAFPLHIVIHELGHLLVAALTGLRVTSVRISLAQQSAVVVEPAGPALPVRMAAFILGGPLANLASAALAWQLWRQPLPTPVRVAAALVAVVGVLMAAANLLPIRWSASTLDPDGLNLLRWVLRPRITTAALGTDPARLDTIIEETRHPLVLLAAVFRRWQLDNGYRRIAAMADRLNAVAHDERTKPAHAAAIAAQLAVTFGRGYLYRGIVEGNPIDRADADELVDVAELGFRLRPRSEAARIGLAIARLLDHRPAQARDLLTGVRAGRPETYALATQVFAVAEIYLGHRERAGALLATIGDGDPVMNEILSTLRATDPPPALVSDPTSVTS